MASRAEHNHNEIGGSTSEKSSPESLIHLNYQETHHVSSSSNFEKISVETNRDTTRSENSDLADNEATIFRRNKRYSNRNISTQNSDDSSRSARQHLLSSRINVRKTAKHSSKASRENIRRKLADQETNLHEKNSFEDHDSKNLLICFMNETLSSDEDQDEENVQFDEIISRTKKKSLIEQAESNFDQIESKINLLQSLTTSSIGQNISRTKGHVIIPLTQTVASTVPNTLENLTQCTGHKLSLNLDKSLPSSCNEDSAPSTHHKLSTNFVKISPSLSDEDLAPISHHKWSLTAAANQSKERSGHGWDGDTSSSEDEGENIITNIFVNHKKSPPREDFDEISCINNIKEYNTHSGDIFNEGEQWRSYSQVSENNRSNDIFCSPANADFCRSQLGSNLEFFKQLASIQSEARKKLKDAKQSACQEVERDRKTRRDISNRDIANLLGCSSTLDLQGLPNHNRRLNRHILTEMKAGQLQVILNYLLSQAKHLNENLVEFLMNRDELAIEQDSLLTDVEDITMCISATSPTDTPSPCKGFSNEQLLNMQTSLDQLLEEISFRRRKELRSKGAGEKKSADGGFSVQSTTYWTDLFVRHFLFQTEYEVDRDDLLFFIRKTVVNNPCYKSRNHVDVYRRDSRKLPIGDPDVDWEETLYLNLIVHQLVYTVTLAVYSRTSHKDIQVLRRYSQKVYATPSRRKMDEKGDSEEITYPYVCFTVDNFDEIFDEVVVRDGESIGIELTATDPPELNETEGYTELVNTVLFSASVPYEALKRVYESRASQTVRKRLSQTNIFSLFSGKGTGPRMEYVRLVSNEKGRGHAELAVSRSKDPSGYYSGTGCDTPSSEPGTDLLDLLDSDSEDGSDFNSIYMAGSSLSQKNNPSSSTNGAENIVGFKRTHRRRLSDPSATINDFIRLGLLERPGGTGAIKSFSTTASRTGSQSEGLDNICGGEASCEIFAGDLLDEFEETAYNPLWTMKGHTQIFHHWRESKRVQCIPVGAFVTYIMLPWWSIVTNVLDHQKRPVLTF